MNSIPNTSTPFSQPLVALLLICGLAAAAATYWSSQPYGLGLGTDSLYYLETAHSLATGQGATTSNGSPFVVQPPLYPALVAVSTLAGIDALVAARFLNVALLCGIIWMAGLMIIRVSRPPAVATLGILAISFSAPLHFVSRTASSEPPFIFFSLLSIIFLSRYLRNSRLLPLVLFTAAVAAACLTRYIGIVFIAAGCLGIIALAQGGIRRRLRDAAFSLTSAIPLALWLVRNEMVSGTLFGPRAPSSHSLLQNIVLTAKTIAAWYLKGILIWYPPTGFSSDASLLTSTSDTFSLILLAVCAVCFCGVWLAAAARLPGLFLSLNSGKRAFLTTEIPPELSTSCVFATAYLAFLVITSTTTAYDEIGTRLLSPMSVFMQVILCFLVSWKADSTVTTWRIRLWRILLLAALAGCLIGPIRATLALHLEMRDQGSAWTGKIWRESETISVLSQNQAVKDGATIFTNAPEALSLYLKGKHTIRTSPSKTMYASPQKAHTLDELRGKWPAENQVILVWFDYDRLGYETNYLFAPDELRLIVNVREINRLADGTIYSVSKKSPNPANE